ncbi:MULTISPECIES: recombinase RecT [Aerococcus]|uniref:Recombinase RecT n=1 Tax=Aerococcus tenax TaxID=3078812 RepID=A0A329PMF1_9LACT|nr:MULTISPECIES: recombinase RecT [Aerococcus]MDL5184745.1 recombinase RecT [Aerococcus mictus]KAA9238598.1 recombinase RecT [Aerococcus urinae]MDK6371970.1 recombinase RecT [Aerococcus urinae]MDK7302411.1 recombinase RecT [Aerococcus urinae]MDK7802269.1 recombinase RecT [Aerococcus urinae]
MATNDTIKQQLSTQKTSQAPAKNTVGTLLKSPAIQNKFQELLKTKSANFTSSLLTLVNNDSYLSDCEPMSIIASSMQAAQLDLPIEKNFGFAYIVPFRDKNTRTKKAQFVLGYKGYIQLAQRSGQYKKINVVPICQGELKTWNKVTEEFEYNLDGKQSDEVIGYVGYFKLLNGFEKTVYWSKEDVEAHRIANNKARDKKALSGVWASNYDAMAMKTVLRNLLSKWGILSIEMQKAVVADESDPEEQALDLAPAERKEVEKVETPQAAEKAPETMGEWLEKNPEKPEQESLDILGTYKK